MPSSSPNKIIEHITEINAPIDTVWYALIDINDWQWNKWFRFEAKEVSKGTKGKLKVSYEGDCEWLQTYDFTFGEIDENTHLMTWFGKVLGGCAFFGDHTVRLEVIGDGAKTRLVHREKFGGLLPALGLGLPYETLDRNYLLFNEGIKEFVEKTS